MQHTLWNCSLFTCAVYEKILLSNTWQYSVAKHWQKKNTSREFQKIMIITPTFFLTSWGKNVTEFTMLNATLSPSHSRKIKECFQDWRKTEATRSSLRNLLRQRAAEGEGREGERGEEGRKEKGRGGVCTWWSEVGSREDKRDNTRGNETTENT